MVVVLELGPFEDEEPHAAEDRLDALAQERQRMAVAERRAAARQRDVDRAGRRPRVVRCGEALVELRFDLLFEIVGELAEPRPRVGRAPSPAP